MSWFKRKKKGITTPSKEKKNTPHGLWVKTPKGEFVDSIELKKNFYISPDAGYHVKIGSQQYFELILDEGKYEEIGDEITSGDPLQFVDTASYKDRVSRAKKKTKLSEAVTTVVGKCNGKGVVVSAMDFSFIGGSLGSAMGERICRGIDKALELKYPMIIVSKSGGARMQEGVLSLMQMAKVCAKLNLLAEAKIPYISLLTDPTMGGVTASFAMIGDINIAEPEATIGFAGRRVIEGMGTREFPEGFQTSEYLMENGFLDMIVDRKNLKKKICMFLDMVFYKNPNIL